MGIRACSAAHLPVPRAYQRDRIGYRLIALLYPRVRSSRYTGTLCRGAPSPRPPHRFGSVMTKVWITVPTLNEIENLDSVVQRVRAAVPDAHILIVDDGSADGTADKADALGAEKGGIEVLRRPRKMGLGSAYRAGHAIGIARGYDVMIQIDADLSHDPAALPSLLPAGDGGADLAIGSRYVPGGEVPSWPKRRLLLSVWGNR